MLPSQAVSLTVIEESSTASLQIPIAVRFQMRLDLISSRQLQVNLTMLGGTPIRLSTLPKTVLEADNSPSFKTPVTQRYL